MRIFLDVGAHDGDTLRAVIDPKYGFDRIVCFEPARIFWAKLARVRDPRLRVCRFGLWRETCRRPLFNPGSAGASIFPDKGEANASEMAHFVRASDWMSQSVMIDDEVFMKLNCEGSECDILDDLMESGEIRKSDWTLIYFDVRKVPSQKHREQEARSRLERLGVRYWAADEIRRGPTHVVTIRNWLEEVGARRPPLRPTERLRSGALRLRYVTIPTAISSTRVGRMARTSFPRPVYALLKPIWARLRRGY